MSEDCWGCARSSEPIEVTISYHLDEAIRAKLWPWSRVRPWKVRLRGDWLAEPHWFRTREQAERAVGAVVDGVRVRQRSACDHGLVVAQAVFPGASNPNGPLAADPASASTPASTPKGPLTCDVAGLAPEPLAPPASPPGAQP